VIVKSYSCRATKGRSPCKHFYTKKNDLYLTNGAISNAKKTTPMVNGSFDHCTVLFTFQLDDVEKTFTNTAVIVMTSKTLAMIEPQARKSGLRMKIDGNTRTYTISIQTAMSNCTISCSSNACQKRKRKPNC
jgi:hypothetical protein